MHVHLGVSLPVVGKLKGKPHSDEIIVLEIERHAAPAGDGTDRGNRGLHAEASVRRGDRHASVREIERIRVGHDVARGFNDDDIADITEWRERT